MGLFGLERKRLRWDMTQICKAQVVEKLDTQHSIQVHLQSEKITKRWNWGIQVKGFPHDTVGKEAAPEERFAPIDTYNRWHSARSPVGAQRPTVHPMKGGTDPPSLLLQPSLPDKRVCSDHWEHQGLRFNFLCAAVELGYSDLMQNKISNSAPALLHLYFLDTAW